MNNLAYKLNDLVLSVEGCRRGIVVACVGTDSVLGDCLGPLVGQMLVNMNVNAYVYGTLINPITAVNADNYSRFIALRHPDAVVIAIDSCVGLKQDLGKIRINGGKLYPASALNKGLLGLGDISLTGIVSGSLPNTREFSSVRLGFTYSLASRAASLIADCIYMYNYRARAQNLQSLNPALSIRV